MRLMLAISISATFWANTVIAGDHNSCDPSGTDGDCLPVYACLGDKGEWFKGHAHGKGKGVLKGHLASGASCTGKWSALNSDSNGKIDLTCNNGTYMQVYYTQTDAETGTALGTGISMDGRFVQGWTGTQVSTYLSNTEGLEASALTCGPNVIPLG